MLNKEIDLQTACGQIQQAALEGRLIGAGLRVEQSECRLLEAIDPSIKSSRECPPSLGPRWMLELIVVLNDGLIDDHMRNVFGVRFAQALRKTEDWTKDRWQIARSKFLLLNIEIAVESAKSVSEWIECWHDVKVACEKVKIMLDSKDTSHDAALIARWAVHDAEDDYSLAVANTALYACQGIAWSAANSCALAAESCARVAAREKLSSSPQDAAGAALEVYAAGMAAKHAAYATLFDGLIELLNS